jgi:hypothetical protein
MLSIQDMIRESGMLSGPEIGEEHYFLHRRDLPSQLILKARKRSEMNLKLKIPEIIGREDQVQR